MPMSMINGAPTLIARTRSFTSLYETVLQKVFPIIQANLTLNGESVINYQEITPYNIESIKVSGLDMHVIELIENNCGISMNDEQLTTVRTLHDFICFVLRCGI